MTKKRNLARDMSLRKAKRLFFKYDGSRFYMSRDGVEETYQSFRVPKHLESAWLQDLTRAKLRVLSRNGNWTVLEFLNHHADYGHLADVIDSEVTPELADCGIGAVVLLHFEVLSIRFRVRECPQPDRDDRVVGSIVAVRTSRHDEPPALILQSIRRTINPNLSG
jgi:hypothetical protein